MCQRERERERESQRDENERDIKGAGGRPSVASHCVYLLAVHVEVDGREVLAEQRHAVFEGQVAHVTVRGQGGLPLGVPAVPGECPQPAPHVAQVDARPYDRPVHLGQMDDISAVLRDLLQL